MITKIHVTSRKNVIKGLKPSQGSKINQDIVANIRNHLQHWYWNWLFHSWKLVAQWMDLLPRGQTIKQQSTTRQHTKHRLKKPKIPANPPKKKQSSLLPVNTVKSKSVRTNSQKAIQHSLWYSPFRLLLICLTKSSMYWSRFSSGDNLHMAICRTPFGSRVTPRRPSRRLCWVARFRSFDRCPGSTSYLFSKIYNWELGIIRSYWRLVSKQGC